MVPLAHANDGGGSTRIPAACCGLVGLKPQRGRISLAPAVGEQFLGRDGVLTRTVRETALALDLLAGPELGDARGRRRRPSRTPTRAARAAGAAHRPAASSRRCPTSPPTAERDAAPRAARRRCSRSSATGRGDRAAVPRRGDPARRSPPCSGRWSARRRSLAAMVHGREPSEEDIEALSMWLWERAAGSTRSPRYGAAFQLQGVARADRRVGGPYDAVLTPALAEPPLTIGTLDPDGPDPQATFARAGPFTPYTAVVNISGQPAISVPLFAARPTACRSACSSSAGRTRRARCSPSPPSSRRRGRGRTAARRCPRPPPSRRSPRCRP